MGSTQNNQLKSSTAPNGGFKVNVLRCTNESQEVEPEVTCWLKCIGKRFHKRCRPGEKSPFEYNSKWE